MSIELLNKRLEIIEQSILQAAAHFNALHGAKQEIMNLIDAMKTEEDVTVEELSKPKKSKSQMKRLASQAN